VPPLPLPMLDALRRLPARGAWAAAAAALESSPVRLWRCTSSSTAGGSGVRAAAELEAAAPPPPPAVGAEFCTSKRYTPNEVAAFLAATGDANAIHVSGAAAAAAGLSAPILPGMLLASLFPAIIGSTFPGALYASQSLAFRAPAAVGAEVRACVVVTAASGSRVRFRTEATAAEGGALLVDGEAIAILGGRRRQRGSGGSDG
jgi:3-hydroxybutyryl-CoA dehydratase